MLQDSKIEMDIKDMEDLSDEHEVDSFIKQEYHPRPDSKFQRIIKTCLINISFIALVSTYIKFAFIILNKLNKLRSIPIISLFNLQLNRDYVVLFWVQLF